MCVKHYCFIFEPKIDAKEKRWYSLHLQFKEDIILKCKQLKYMDFHCDHEKCCLQRFCIWHPPGLNKKSNLYKALANNDLIWAVQHLQSTDWEQSAIAKLMVEGCVEYV